MVLEEASERKFHQITNKDGSTFTYYADIPLGVYIVRGDSMVLLGQVDEVTNINLMKQVELNDLDEMISKEEATKEETQLEWDFDKDLLA
jgi:hypothetical protein